MVGIERHMLSFILEALRLTLSKDDHQHKNCFSDTASSRVPRFQNEINILYTMPS